MIINRLIHCWLFGMLAVSSTFVHAGAPPITVSCWVPAHSPHFMALEKIYRESFAALGYEFAMVHRPLMRAIQDANHGISDGECARDTHYLDTAPNSNLLRVNVVVASAELQVWSNDPETRIGNLTELNNGFHRIGYLIGSSITKTLLTEERMKDSQALIDANIGLKMLSAGRIDVLIASEASIEIAMSELQLPHPVFHAGTLLRQSAYLHLHPRHRKLLPGLTEQLRKRIPTGGIVLE